MRDKVVYGLLIKVINLCQGRNIDRDIGVVKEYFSNSFEYIHGAKGEKSCYKAITKDVLNNFLDKDTLAFNGTNF